MKKFLIFLVSIVIVVCLGLTTFYFMKNDEIITISTKEIYCNAGDTISLESLGIVRKKANKKTTFNYNAGGEKVESAIKFDKEKGYYVVNGEVAGDIDLVISTSNKKYATFTIKVHVGNGDKETPYYIFNETDLNKIGNIYGLSDYYQLMNDITLTSAFEPIGYSEVGSAWIGFSGGFNGNGKTINAMNLSGEYANAGFFSSINANATVSNLKFNNATINGAYSNAGVLAGVVDGLVDRVVVTNSTVTNTANNSFTGAFAGVYNNSTLKMAYADNVTINVGATTNATVGGFIGKVNQATIQAAYVNNSQINVNEGSTGVFGGFAGEFVIGTETGSIQQSYSNVTSENTSMAAFIGKISKAEGFAGTNATSIRYLIGNAAVLNGATKLVASYDDAVFTSFEDVSKSSYLISSYVTKVEMIGDSEGLVFYAIDSQNVVLWDTEYVWIVSNSELPELRLGNIEPAAPSGDYFRKDLTENEVNEDGNSFEETFSTDKTNEKFSITDNVTLTSWTPVALKNCTIEGNNKTITITLDKANGENLGLFSSLDNCTIKNLNIIVKDITANATNVGALAGTILSTDELSSSTIENVNVIIEKVSNITATNFGSIVGVADKTNILKSTVNNAVVNANIANVGTVVGELKNATVKGIKVITATISGTEKVGGVAAINAGTISDIDTLNVTINYNAEVENANVAGIVAKNSGSVYNVVADVTINVNSAKTAVYAGGAVAANSGTIENVRLTGNGIVVAEINAVVYAGGIAANNSGTIKLVQNNLSQVGSYNIGKNVKSAGVVAINSGSISQVKVTSSVYGNQVAGVVVEMNNVNAVIDQVYVGNNNEIKGDRYVAGVAVVFKSGKITNVQAASSIIGAANSTRSSLVVLVFPYGAKLQNATISSSITGYGTFYKETWKDFSGYDNKAEFGLSALKGDDTFNLYANDTHHGSMQSVVIDSSKDGVSNAKSAMGDAWAWEVSYTNSSESSFVKTVNGFSNVSQFTGSFTFKCAESSWFGINHNASKTLTFEIGKVWEDNGSGISLIFLSKLK